MSVANLYDDPPARRLRQSENPTANIPVTVTPETKPPFYVPRGISGQGGLDRHAVAPPVTKQSQRIALPVPGEERDLVLPLWTRNDFVSVGRDDAFAGDSIGERVLPMTFDIERVVFEFTEPGEQGRAFQISNDR